MHKIVMVLAFNWLLGVLGFAADISSSKNAKGENKLLVDLEHINKFSQKELLDTLKNAPVIEKILFEQLHENLLILFDNLELPKDEKLYKITVIHSYQLCFLVEYVFGSIMELLFNPNGQLGVYFETRYRAQNVKNLFWMETEEYLKTLEDFLIKAHDSMRQITKTWKETQKSLNKMTILVLQEVYQNLYGDSSLKHSSFKKNHLNCKKFNNLGILAGLYILHSLTKQKELLFAILCLPIENQMNYDEILKTLNRKLTTEKTNSTSPLITIQLMKQLMEKLDMVSISST